MFFVNFGYAQDDYNLKIAQSDIVTPTDASNFVVITLHQL